MDAELLAWAADELTKAGVSNARMESIWLLREFGEREEIFKIRVRERKEGRPLAYILGNQEFEGLNFRVN